LPDSRQPGMAALIRIGTSIRAAGQQCASAYEKVII